MNKNELGYYQYEAAKTVSIICAELRAQLRKEETQNIVIAVDSVKELILLEDNEASLDDINFFRDEVIAVEKIKAYVTTLREAYMNEDVDGEFMDMYGDYLDVPVFLRELIKLMMFC